MYRSSTPAPLVVAILGALSLLGWAVVRVVEYVEFTQEVKGHLKLAADANSIELARKELEIAVDSLESSGTCPSTGHTSILWRTPDEDAGFWCENLAATLEDLESAGDASDNLTESNMLINVRETLLDTGQNGDHVTAPDGITVYPHNGAFAWWGFLSLITIGAAGLFIK